MPKNNPNQSGRSDAMDSSAASGAGSVNSLGSAASTPGSAALGASQLSAPGSAVSLGSAASTPGSAALNASQQSAPGSAGSLGSAGSPVGSDALAASMLSSARDESARMVTPELPTPGGPASPPATSTPKTAARLRSHARRGSSVTGGAIPEGAEDEAEAAASAPQSPGEGQASAAASPASPVAKPNTPTRRGSVNKAKAAQRAGQQDDKAFNALKTYLDLTPKAKAKAKAKGKDKSKGKVKVDATLANYCDIVNELMTKPQLNFFTNSKKQRGALFPVDALVALFEHLQGDELGFKYRHPYLKNEELYRACQSKWEILGEKQGIKGDPTKWAARNQTRLFEILLWLMELGVVDAIAQKARPIDGSEELHFRWIKSAMDRRQANYEGFQVPTAASETQGAAAVRLLPTSKQYANARKTVIELVVKVFNIYFTRFPEDCGYQPGDRDELRTVYDQNIVQVVRALEEEQALEASAEKAVVLEAENSALPASIADLQKQVNASQHAIAEQASLVEELRQAAQAQVQAQPGDAAGADVSDDAASLTDQLAAAERVLSDMQEQNASLQESLEATQSRSRNHSAAGTPSLRSRTASVSVATASPASSLNGKAAVELSPQPPAEVDPVVGVSATSESAASEPVVPASPVVNGSTSDASARAAATPQLLTPKMQLNFDGTVEDESLVSKPAASEAVPAEAHADGSDNESGGSEQFFDASSDEDVEAEGVEALTDDVTAAIEAELAANALEGGPSDTSSPRSSARLSSNGGSNAGSNPGSNAGTRPSSRAEGAPAPAPELATPAAAPAASVVQRQLTPNVRVTLRKIVLQKTVAENVLAELQRRQKVINTSLTDESVASTARSEHDNNLLTVSQQLVDTFESSDYSQRESSLEVPQEPVENILAQAKQLLNDLRTFKDMVAEKPEERREYFADLMGLPEYEDKFDLYTTYYFAHEDKHREPTFKALHETLSQLNTEFRQLARVIDTELDSTIESSHDQSPEPEADEVNDDDVLQEGERVLEGYKLSLSTIFEASLEELSRYTAEPSVADESSAEHPSPVDEALARLQKIINGIKDARAQLDASLQSLEVSRAQVEDAQDVSIPAPARPERPATDYLPAAALSSRLAASGGAAEVEEVPEPTHVSSPESEAILYRVYRGEQLPEGSTPLSEALSALVLEVSGDNTLTKGMLRLLAVMTMTGEELTAVTLYDSITPLLDKWGVVSKLEQWHLLDALCEGAVAAKARGLDVEGTSAELRAVLFPKASTESVEALAASEVSTVSAETPVAASVASSVAPSEVGEAPAASAAEALKAEHEEFKSLYAESLHEYFPLYQQKGDMHAKVKSCLDEAGRLERRLVEFRSQESFDSQRYWDGLQQLAEHRKTLDAWFEKAFPSEDNLAEKRQERLYRELLNLQPAYQFAWMARVTDWSQIFGADDGRQLALLRVIMHGDPEDASPGVVFNEGLDRITFLLMLHYDQLDKPGMQRSVRERIKRVAEAFQQCVLVDADSAFHQNDVLKKYKQLHQACSEALGDVEALRKQLEEKSKSRHPLPALSARGGEARAAKPSEAPLHENQAYLLFLQAQKAATKKGDTAELDAGIDETKREITRQEAISPPGGAEPIYETPVSTPLARTLWTEEEAEGLAPLLRISVVASNHYEEKFLPLVESAGRYDTYGLLLLELVAVLDKLLFADNKPCNPQEEAMFLVYRFLLLSLCEAWCHPAEGVDTADDYALAASAFDKYKNVAVSLIQAIWPDDLPRFALEKDYTNELVGFIKAINDNDLKALLNKLGKPEMFLGFYGTIWSRLSELFEYVWNETAREIEQPLQRCLATVLRELPNDTSQLPRKHEPDYADAAEVDLDDVDEPVVPKADFDDHAYQTYRAILKADWSYELPEIAGVDAKNLYNSDLAKLIYTLRLFQKYYEGVDQLSELLKAAFPVTRISGTTFISWVNVDTSKVIQLALSVMCGFKDSSKSKGKGKSRSVKPSYRKAMQVVLIALANPLLSLENRYQLKILQVGLLFRGDLVRMKKHYQHDNPVASLKVLKEIYDTLHSHESEFNNIDAKKGQVERLLLAVLNEIAQGIQNYGKYRSAVKAVSAELEFFADPKRCPLITVNLMAAKTVELCNKPSSRFCLFSKGGGHKPKQSSIPKDKLSEIAVRIGHALANPETAHDLLLVSSGANQANRFEEFNTNQRIRLFSAAWQLMGEHLLPYLNQVDLAVGSDQDKTREQEDCYQDLAKYSNDLLFLAMLLPRFDKNATLKDLQRKLAEIRCNEVFFRYVPAIANDQYKLTTEQSWWLLAENFFGFQLEVPSRQSGEFPDFSIHVNEFSTRPAQSTELYCEQFLRLAKLCHLGARITTTPEGVSEFAQLALIAYIKAARFYPKNFPMGGEAGYAEDFLKLVQNYFPGQQSLADELFAALEYSMRQDPSLVLCHVYFSGVVASCSDPVKVKRLLKGVFQLPQSILSPRPRSGSIPGSPARGSMPSPDPDVSRSSAHSDDGEPCNLVGWCKRQFSVSNPAFKLLVQYLSNRGFAGTASKLSHMGNQLTELDEVDEAQLLGFIQATRAMLQVDAEKLVSMPHLTYFQKLLDDLCFQLSSERDDVIEFAASSLVSTAKLSMALQWVYEPSQQADGLSGWLYQSREGDSCHEAFQEALPERIALYEIFSKAMLGLALGLERDALETPTARVSVNDTIKVLPKLIVLNAISRCRELYLLIAKKHMDKPQWFTGLSSDLLRASKLENVSYAYLFKVAQSTIADFNSLNQLLEGENKHTVKQAILLLDFAKRVEPICHRLDKIYSKEDVNTGLVLSDLSRLMELLADYQIYADERIRQISALSCQGLPLNGIERRTKGALLVEPLSKVLDPINKASRYAPLMQLSVIVARCDAKAAIELFSSISFDAFEPAVLKVIFHATWRLVLRAHSLSDGSTQDLFTQFNRVAEFIEPASITIRDKRDLLLAMLPAEQNIDLSQLDLRSRRQLFQFLAVVFGDELPRDFTQSSVLKLFWMKRYADAQHQGDDEVCREIDKMVDQHPDKVRAELLLERYAMRLETLDRNFANELRHQEWQHCPVDDGDTALRNVTRRLHTWLSEKASSSDDSGAEVALKSAALWGLATLEAEQGRITSALSHYQLSLKDLRSSEDGFNVDERATIEAEYSLLLLEHCSKEVAVVSYEQLKDMKTLLRELGSLASEGQQSLSFKLLHARLSNALCDYTYQCDKLFVHAPDTLRQLSALWFDILSPDFNRYFEASRLLFDFLYIKASVYGQAKYNGHDVCMRTYPGDRASLKSAAKHMLAVVQHAARPDVHDGLIDILVSEVKGYLLQLGCKDPVVAPQVDDVHWRGDIVSRGAGVETLVGPMHMFHLPEVEAQAAGASARRPSLANSDE